MAKQKARASTNKTADKITSASVKEQDPVQADGTPFDEPGTVGNEVEPDTEPELQKDEGLQTENPITERMGLGLLDKEDKETMLPVKTIIDRTGTDDAPAG